MDINKFIEDLLKLNGPELSFDSASQLNERVRAFAALPDVERQFGQSSMTLGVLLLVSALAQAAAGREERDATTAELLPELMAQVAALRASVDLLLESMTKPQEGTDGPTRPAAE